MEKFRIAEMEEAKYYEQAQKRLQSPFEERKKTIEAYPYDKDEKIKLICKSSNSIAFKNSAEEDSSAAGEVHYFRGKIILYYLISTYNNNNINKYMRAISIFVGFARGYLPMFGIESWNFFPGEDNWEKIILFLLNFSLIYFYQYITRFVL